MRGLHHRTKSSPHIPAQILVYSTFANKKGSPQHHHFEVFFCLNLGHDNKCNNFKNPKSGSTRKF